MKEINLKNVKLIGDTAFKCTSLKVIKNNFIKELDSTQFSDLFSDI